MKGSTKVPLPNYDCSPEDLWWEALDDRQLLEVRICHLNCSIKGSSLEPFVKRFYRELTTLQLEHFKPYVYLGDEWFSPDATNAISIPFYLSHRRLRSLERRFFGAIEGGSPTSFMRLMRHECGHCFDHAYNLSRKRDYRRLFGNPNQNYNPDLLTQPRSKSWFVEHLGDDYAQTHPCEDFAETFATVITPGLDWNKLYKRRPLVIEKLNWVERQIELHRFRAPENHLRRPMSLARHLRSTLGSFYRRRLRQLTMNPPTQKKILLLEHHS